MKLAYIVRVTDGYETYKLRGYTDSAKAHFDACKESQSEWRDATYVTADDNGKPVFHAKYVNGGCVTMYYGPEDDLMALPEASW